MILYGSSGIGALEEVLLLWQLVQREKDEGVYFIYPHSPDTGVRALHNRFCLGSEQPSFRLSGEIIDRDFGLKCVELGHLLAEHGLWDIKLTDLMEQVPGQDYNALNHINFREGARKRDLIRSDSYLGMVMDKTVGELHKKGFYLGGRLIYWFLSRICLEEGWYFMAPAIRTDSVYSFFEERLLMKVGYWHIRLAGSVTPEESWEPVPPTIWPYLNKELRLDLTEKAKWLVDHYPIKAEVLLEGDKNTAKAFYRRLPLF